MFLASLVFLLCVQNTCQSILAPAGFVTWFLRLPQTCYLAPTQRLPPSAFALEKVPGERPCPEPMLGSVQP